MIMSGIHKSRLVYEDRDTLEIAEFFVPYDEQTASYVTETIESLVAHVDAYKLMEIRQPCLPNSLYRDKEYRWCRHKGTCAALYELGDNLQKFNEQQRPTPSSTVEP